MNQSGINIFDLLSGSVEQNQVTPNSITGEQPVDSFLFGNMLDSLINVRKNNQFPGLENHGTDNFAPFFTENIINDSDIKKTDASSISLPELEKSEIFGLLFDVNNEKFNLNNVARNPFVEKNEIASEQVVNELPVTPEETRGNIRSFNKALSQLVEFAPTVANKQILNLLNQAPVNLESGTYNIQSAIVYDNSLELSVVKPENPESIIKVSLPLEQLQLNKTNIQNSNARVNLNVDGSFKHKFEHLIESVNLKELVVKEEPSITNNQIEKPQSNSLKLVNIEIVAENSGQVQVIKGKLFKDSIQAFRKNERPIITNNNTQLAADEDNDPVLTRPVMSKSEPTVLRNNLPFEEILTGKKSITNGFETSQKFDENLMELNLANSSKDINNIKIEDKTEIRPVRFTLPDDIHTALKPNGKSVNILIEPENIGQARLKLVMHNQTLRAELLVNSAQAKAVVENSLNQLVDQLNNSDIKVEYIHVNLNNDQAHRQFSRHQHNWHKQFNGNNSKTSADDVTNYMAPLSNVGSRTNYVGADGVNVWA